MIINYKKAVKALAIAAVLLILAYLGTYKLWQKAAYPKKYQQQVAAAANSYGIDENLLYAVIRTESGFNKDAVSKKGAKGLMQLTDETLWWISSKCPELNGVASDELFDPQTNINAGAAFLKLLLDEYKDQKTALAAYNAGRANVQKWLKDDDYSQNGVHISDTPYKETSGYIKKVMNAYEMYQKLYR